MTDAISPNVVIMTREEMQAAITASFHRGVERGKFEESCARYSQAQGLAGQSEATENTGPASSDAAVRLTNLIEGVKELREVWFTGGDLDKDAISQKCLSLFKWLPAK